MESTKMERGTELVMLEVVVLPAIEKAKGLLDNRTELEKVVWHDIIGLLLPYRDSEMEKYENAPDNLKEAPKVQRMLDNVNSFDTAIALLVDAESKKLKPIGEEELNSIALIVKQIINS